jgi:hypothetical protein
MASKRAPVTQKATKLQWSPDRMDELRQAGLFAHVGGDRAKTSRLSGAFFYKWGAEEPEAIFNTQYRISGRNPQVVYEALLAANYSPADARRIVDDSVSATNYQTTKKKEYEAELNYRKGMPKAKKAPVEGGYEIPEILWFAEQLKEKGRVRIEQKVNSGKKAVAQPGRAQAGQSFADKLVAVPEGKVLDVSGMDLLSKNGAGSRTIPVPGAKSGKVGAPGIPKLVSNKVEAYRRAVQLAYGDQGLVDHANDIAHVEVALNGKGEAVVAPVKPVVVPGQTLAPSVNLQPLLPSAVRTGTSSAKATTPKVASTGIMPPPMPSLRR